MLANISVETREGRAQRARTSRQKKINDKPWRFEFRGNGMSWGVLRATQETRSWIWSDASADAAPPNCGIHLTPMKHAPTNTPYSWINSNSTHYKTNLRVYGLPAASIWHPLSGIHVFQRILYRSCIFETHNFPICNAIFIPQTIYRVVAHFMLWYFIYGMADFKENMCIKINVSRTTFS